MDGNMDNNMDNNTNQRLSYPLDYPFIQRHQKKLRRELKARLSQPAMRVAVLGGSTTQEVSNYIELFLLQAGVNVEIFESDYNRFYESALFDDGALKAFDPQIIYLHTSSVNVTGWPAVDSTQTSIDAFIGQLVHRFQSVWTALTEKFNASIIQNNFELPGTRPLGNQDAIQAAGRSYITRQINQRFAEHAQNTSGFILHDLNYLSARFGLDRWYDPAQWYAYKFAMSREAFIEVGYSVAAQIKAAVGLVKKVVICDLDNTLWGGVIGDDGLDGIQVGAGNATAEGFSDLQTYLKALRERGILLAVCSKNERQNAEDGFTHPDSVLKLDDFSAFQANWNHKPGNIEQIARDLNLGLGAMVFLDDNPAERAIVAQNLPAIAVPDIGDDSTRYIHFLDRSGLFEQPSLSQDDFQRASMYAQNQQRTELENASQNYGDYLQSLQMTATIEPVNSMALPRAAQLINKTNQFNLTGLRFTEQEVAGFMDSPDYLTLYGRLTDRFGDNGIVSVIVGERQGSELHIRCWVMSCRVFKREMEAAMLSGLLSLAKENGIDNVIGYYVPREKNGLVKDFYQESGFQLLHCSDDNSSQWQYSIGSEMPERDIPITINPATE